MSLNPKYLWNTQRKLDLSGLPWYVRLRYRAVHLGSSLTFDLAEWSYMGASNLCDQYGHNKTPFPDSDGWRCSRCLVSSYPVRKQW